MSEISSSSSRGYKRQDSTKRARSRESTHFEISSRFMDRWEDCLIHQESIMQKQERLLQEQTIIMENLVLTIKDLPKILRDSTLKQEIWTDNSKLEGESRSASSTRRPEAKEFNSSSKIKLSEKCFRCNKPGHKATECPLVSYNLWYCYFCQAVANHKGDECPNKDNPKDGFIKSKNYYDSSSRYKSTIREFRENNSWLRGKLTFRGSDRGRGGSFKKMVKPSTPGRKQKQTNSFNEAKHYLTDTEIYQDIDMD